MRSLTANFKSEKNKSQNQPIFLYTIYDYDGSSNNLYFAEWDSNVVFDSITYTRFPISHDIISETTSGEIGNIKLTVANVSRLIQGYLEQYDFRGKRVRVMLVWANQLADTTAYIEDYYYVDNYTADESNVVFTLASKFDVLDLELPARRYMRNYCSWKFKSTECGYAGATATCNKTKQACIAMTGGSNLLRFGGFPSVPTQRIYVT